MVFDNLLASDNVIISELITSNFKSVFTMLLIFIVFESLEFTLIKFCFSSLVEPISLLYSTSLRVCVFTCEWKSGIIVPVYKENDKNNIKNYRLLFLVPFQKFSNVFYMMSFIVLSLT